MICRLFAPFIIAVVLTPSIAWAQSPQVLDLGSGTTQTKSAPAGMFNLQILNRLPLEDYHVSVIDRIRPVDALPALEGAKAAGSSADPCATLVTRAEALSITDKAPKTEVAMKKEVTDIRKKLKAQTCAAQEEQINASLSATVIDLGDFEVPEGHELIVNVARKDGDKDLSWSLTLQGPARGLWLTTYGMAFTSDRGQKFFTKANGTSGAGAYTITAESPADRFDLKPMPSVFFTWLSRDQQDRSWAHGWTAGFGLEGGARPAIFAGYSGTFRWNLGVVVGVAAVPEIRLAGRYSSDQKVAEDLAAEALHKTTVRPRWLAAVTYRFGSNPFKAPAAAEGGDKAKEKPADPKKGG